MLERAIRGPKRPALYLGLRDVLDSPEVIRGAWRELGAYEYLPHYDGVLVYGCEDMYDADEAYDLASHAQQVVYCNYVGPPAMAEPANGESNQPLVLVMGGGGADAFAMASTFLAAMPAMRRSVDLRAVLLTGPHMAAPERNALLAQSESLPVTLQTSVDDVTPLLRGVSAVISMAGYNSMCEVVDARCKALIVPRRGPSAEQRIRSYIFAERQLIRVLDPDVLTPRRLSDGLLQLLATDTVPNQGTVPPLDGAKRVATVLLNGVTAALEPLNTRRVVSALANVGALTVVT
jgi:predicted glycosyltransferase